MNPATWDVIASLGGFAGIAALVTAARGLRGVRDQLAPSPPGTAPGTLADNMALLADMVSSLGHQIGEANATHDRELRHLTGQMERLENRVERLEKNS